MKNKNNHFKTIKKIIPIAFALILAVTVFCVPAYAAGNVSGVIEDTWNAARSQLQEVVDNVVLLVQHYQNGLISIFQLP